MRSVVVVSMFSLLLAGCGGPPSIEDWLQQLKDASAIKRRQAIRELGALERNDERVATALVQALNDKDGYVRRDAAITLAKTGVATTSVAPALKAALKDKKRGVRKAAARSLQRIAIPTGGG